LRIDSSTIAGNEAFYGGGGLVIGPFMGRDTYVTNSTIAGNEADVGGGVFHYGSNPDGGRELFLTGVTIAGNEASNAGGGIARFDSTHGVVQLTDSIVADNAAPDDPDIASPSPGPGDEVAARYSLIETPGSPFTDQGRNITGKDPQLGALALSGGPTAVLFPSATSPVLDKGLSSGLTSDQRGEPRPVDNPGIFNSPAGDGADLGAVESAAQTAPLVKHPKKKKCKKKRKKGKSAAAAKKCKKKKKK
jgi:hypothetical protein